MLVVAQPSPSLSANTVNSGGLKHGTLAIALQLLKPLVKCFILIGTGNPVKKAFNGGRIKFLGQTLVQIAAETADMERKFIGSWAEHFNGWESPSAPFNLVSSMLESGS
jgi:hypothetical protein